MSLTSVSPDKVKEAAQYTERALFPVSGDCLEGVQVMNGGWVAVDFTRRPAPPRYRSEGGDGSIDLCLCLAVWPGQKTPSVMVKAYDGTMGAMHMVSTRYAVPRGSEEYRFEVGMQAVEIYGVIFASWDRDGTLLWQRDPSEFPESLPDSSTIYGECCPLG